MKLYDKTHLSSKLTFIVAVYVASSMVFIFAYTLGMYFLLRNLGVIQVIQYTSGNDELVLALTLRKMVWFLSVLILWVASTGFMCVLLKKRINKTINPIYDVIDATSKIAAGRKSIELKRVSDDEFGQLSEAINEMASSLHDARDASASKDSFIANVSHEIRTPMNAILGFSELILQLDESQEVNGYARDIKRASNNLLAIINDLLDISKIESGRMEINPVTYNTNYLLMDVESVISIPMQKKGLTLRSHINPELPCELYGDIVRVRQILINLLNNAVKFTREGYIDFTADFSPVEGKQDYVMMVFKVEDTGIGMHTEDLEVIFEKFRQVDHKKNIGIEGTGLGLSISKQLAVMMDGDISVQSEYGKGTIFTVRIPQKVSNYQKLSSYFVHQNVETAQQRRRFYAPSAKVLVVDDNSVNLRILNGLLRHYQIEATIADSGQMAIDLVKQTDYDLIFLDHIMPGMDGVETLSHIRKISSHYASVPVVAVSANALTGIHARFVDSGFTDFLPKPIEVDKLEASLKKYLPKNLLIEDEVEEKVAAPEIDFEIKGVDVFSGLLKCDNDVADYLDILKIFYECGPAKMEELQNYVNQGNIDSYVISVHALKSVAANIGAHKLSTMARIHELAGKNKQDEFIRTNATALLELYDSVISNIGTVLKEKNLF